jgi:signal transduction histidine kinase
LQDSSPDLDELRAIVEDIRKDDHRAGEVINRMRAMMKHRQTEKGYIDLKLLLDEALVLVKLDAEKRKVQVVLDIHPCLLFMATRYNYSKSLSICCSTPLMPWTTNYRTFPSLRFRCNLSAKPSRLP